ncbi:TfoX/Sxy family protein [Ancylobacter amanitiformis]|uniref:DNA transformation protein n=1 Tax=Ancylobacter amanitiformis TaxID=217069 RepID=A0ABU0LUA4_9HYPH|nr:TfoX/Sxy family protein [Ancylobacter amanitiformis]MDQ0512253.1 DNA transformation protein [Ancylobacter amanitiformis]
MDEAAIGDVFAAFRPVRCRRTFGGLGLYAEGVMFGLVAGDRIYLKTDPAFAAELARHGAVPFVYAARGRQVRVAYWSLPDAALDDAEAAADYAMRALGLALAAKAMKPPRH